MAVIDCHTHAFPVHIAAGAIRSLVAEAKWQPCTAHHDGTVAGLLASMDRAGIDRAVMCSVATRPQQVRKITDWSASAASQRIIPFASIHPAYEEPEAEAERIASLGLRGIKFHPQYMDCAADDPRTIRVARAAAANGLAMALHTGYDLGFGRDDLGAPQRVRRLHEAVPRLRLLACHMGGWQRWQEAKEHLLGLPIYLEPSFCLFGQCPPELLLEMLQRHPRQYILFGTDSPWADQKNDLEEFRRLPIDPAIISAALWDNALAFLGIGQPGALLR